MGLGWCDGAAAASQPIHVWGACGRRRARVRTPAPATSALRPRHSPPYLAAECRSAPRVVGAPRFPTTQGADRGSLARYGAPPPAKPPICGPLCRSSVYFSEHQPRPISYFPHHFKWLGHLHQGFSETNSRLVAAGGRVRLVPTLAPRSNRRAAPALPLLGPVPEGPPSLPPGAGRWRFPPGARAPARARDKSISARACPR